MSPELRKWSCVCSAYRGCVRDELTQTGVEQLFACLFVGGAGQGMDGAWWAQFGPALWCPGLRWRRRRLKRNRLRSDSRECVSGSWWGVSWGPHPLCHEPLEWAPRLGRGPKGWRLRSRNRRKARVPLSG